MMALLVTAGLAATLSLLIDLMVGGLLATTGAVSILGEFLRLRLSLNPGISFSIRLPSPWQEILIGTALLAVVGVALSSKQTRLSGIGFGLIFGGAAANLIDRALDGTVTDFIAVGTFPIFNAADSCITVGAVLLLLEAWMHRQRHPEGR